MFVMVAFSPIFILSHIHARAGIALNQREGGQEELRTCDHLISIEELHGKADAKEVSCSLKGCGLLLLHYHVRVGLYYVAN